MEQGLETDGMKCVPGFTWALLGAGTARDQSLEVVLLIAALWLKRTGIVGGLIPREDVAHGTTEQILP